MSSTSDILAHIINPAQGDLAPDLARYILDLHFPSTDHARYEQLAEKAQSGTLTDQERADLDFFLNLNDFLSIIQAKARSSLNNRSSAA